jgi:hypothetical protein
MHIERGSVNYYHNQYHDGLDHLNCSASRFEVDSSIIVGFSYLSSPCQCIHMFLICYLMLLSVSWLHRATGEIIHKYGAVDGMRIDKVNWSTRRKPAPVLLCPPLISQDLTWDQTQASMVGFQRLTAWNVAQPTCQFIFQQFMKFGLGSFFKTTGNANTVSGIVPHY